MRSTVLSRTLAAALFLCAATDVLAAGREPIYLMDPTFQIQYDKRVVEFEPMPLSVLQRCEQAGDFPNLTPVLFIYARTVDSHGRVFYAAGGYEYRVDPNNPLIRKYHVGGYGGVFFLDGEKCQQIGPILDTFTAGPYEETTEEVLAALAADMKSRYEKAFHNRQALMKAFRRHRVKANAHAPQLNKAFAPYYVK